MKRQAMKRSRFSDEQIIGILKEHQVGLSATELCRKYGVSDATFYKWRSKYGGMDVASRWLTAGEAERTDGVVAKCRDGLYLSGERAMVGQTATQG
jgi:transposase-like protein